jgi:RNA polymerase sigma-70 factor (ECF subfamily)
VEAAILTDQSKDATAGRVVLFEDFYRAARDDVARALVLTLGNRELGVEAADEAMTRAYRRWDRIASYDSPAGWVYRVGLNWARSVLRKRRREVGGVYGTVAVDDPVGDVDVERALAALEVPFRAVVVLRLYLDWSVEATAEALGIRPGTVKSRMSRALARLEETLGGENR